MITFNHRRGENMSNEPKNNYQKITVGGGVYSRTLDTSVLDAFKNKELKNILRK